MSHKGGTYCVVRGCHSKTGENISLFSFPKDPERVKCWLKACNRDDLLEKNLNAMHKNYKVCEHHFEEKYLSKGSETRKHLFQQAVPSVFTGEIKQLMEEKQDFKINSPVTKQ